MSYSTTNASTFATLAQMEWQRKTNASVLVFLFLISKLTIHTPQHTFSARIATTNTIKCNWQEWEKWNRSRLSMFNESFQAFILFVLCVLNTYTLCSIDNKKTRRRRGQIPCSFWSTIRFLMYEICNGRYINYEMTYWCYRSRNIGKRWFAMWIRVDFSRVNAIFRIFPPSNEHKHWVSYKLKRKSGVFHFRNVALT